ncbi:MAG TPA: hypothetical protein VGB05_04615, partial [Pyrinomonadaceae bacterium]
LNSQGERGLNLPTIRTHLCCVVTDRIASELRHQYVIGFTPTNAAQGGKWNKVNIKVTPRSTELKSLLVRSREGYFSPSPPAP